MTHLISILGATYFVYLGFSFLFLEPLVSLGVPGIIASSMIVALSMGLLSFNEVQKRTSYGHYGRYTTFIKYGASSDMVTKLDDIKRRLKGVRPKMWFSLFVSVVATLGGVSMYVYEGMEAPQLADGSAVVQHAISQDSINSAAEDRELGAINADEGKKLTATQNSIKKHRAQTWDAAGKNIKPESRRAIKVLEANKGSIVTAAATARQGVRDKYASSRNTLNDNKLHLLSAATFTNEVKIGKFKTNLGIMLTIVLLIALLNEFLTFYGYLFVSRYKTMSSIEVKGNPMAQMSFASAATPLRPDAQGSQTWRTPTVAPTHTANKGGAGSGERAALLAKKSLYQSRTPQRLKQDFNSYKNKYNKKTKEGKDTVTVSLCMVLMAGEYQTQVGKDLFAECGISSLFMAIDDVATKEINRIEKLSS